MGMNSENASRLVFDIETAPLPDAADYLEPAEAPSNYKDPIKIQEFIAAKNAENLERCGLDVDLCRVVAIGFQWEGQDPNAMTLADCDEDGLIKAFWKLANLRDIQRHLVGFNCLAFDLPVLLRRSQYLGISAPPIQVDRFKHPQVTDLLSVLSFNGAIKFRGLAFYAKRFGILSTDIMTGADVAQAVREERWKDIAAHVQADVAKTAAIAERLGLFRGVSEAVL